MTNNEHLLENAINAMQQGYTVEEWFAIEPNPCTIEHADLIWELAQCVVYSYTPSMKLEVIQQMEEAYGYKIIERFM